MATAAARERARKIHSGMRQAVRKALREHKRAGRCIYIERDGKIVRIPPDKIPVK